ncbi:MULTISPECIES: TOPRIM nucleotidyl transferase/hydrolase domain-containing protein [unclassified Leifsonia]|uniref:TOPRIM nucleotidyl transferase/hydrolase domain-containing protein n=1 Tax=unclassified Leifsonia TaxID=2663824 RepID=UPI0006F23252|nr:MULTISPECIES: TOPRIM nucleotidyl transferase/hydrolase domain-containing protein [unclassified Leifsonia]KQX05592.1 hypothetical protein ASC59_16000 [Leifsonia sp. Root1293]KRA09226.1 hypothetical protein ASD61_15995 [Leifsonia sp. Root60]
MDPADLARFAAASAGIRPLRRVVLVEGDSDREAVLQFAATVGRDLPGEGTAVVGMGGANSLPRFLEITRATDQGLALTGLCDEQEVPVYRRALERVGLADAAHPVPLEELGFFACRHDLEDELIRALGIDVAVAIIAEQGEGARFEGMRRQPAQRERALADQLHRFIGAGAGRKARVARAFAERIPAERIPEPILGLLSATLPT